MEESGRPGARVGAFVKAAFPDATIPYHNVADHRDYSQNFKSNSNWQELHKPEGDQRYAQAPIWPADLFGVTSALLERSGVYQRLANDIAPNSKLKFAEFEWAGKLEPDSKEGLDSDIFGVHAHHRLLLRLIGALWRHGALFISGRHKFDGEFADEAYVLSKNKDCAIESLNSLKIRNNKEYNDSIVDSLCNEVTQFFVEKLDICSNKILYNKLDPYKINKLSEIICDKFQDYAQITLTGIEGSDACDRKMEHFKPGHEGAKALSHHFLVLWACHYINWHWNKLLTSGRKISLSLRDEPNSQDHEWWRAAMRLLIIADEAGKGTGFTGASEHEPSHGSDVLELTSPLPVGLRCATIWSEYLLREARRPDGRRTFPTTIARCLDSSLGAVLPKTRTPSNGCTIRSLSHNFSLLPHKGRVRARWIRQPKASEGNSFNLLLVPYPYQIKSRHVEPKRSDDAADWGFFSVNPDWLYEDHKTGNVINEQEAREAFWRFLKSLLDTQTGGIDALILPEGAIDGETFDFVQTKLLEECPYITMFVCGLTSQPPSYKPKIPSIRGGSENLSGNFVATYLRHKDSHVVGEPDKPDWATRLIRAKHHRWKVDVRQLESYALSHRLPPDKVWWEDIDLPPREMLFAEFSTGSVVTTLICEDLARIEPCQVALRAVGPNLVLVLLMDTAQKVQRWPYQYAGILADDPGSSVLTLTSYGLIGRSNLSEDRDSREIAVWREPHTGRAREIKLPKGYDAQLLSIRREFCTEQTLDGRSDNGDSAIVWRFAGLIPLKARSDPPGGRADD